MKSFVLLLLAVFAFALLAGSFASADYMWPPNYYYRGITTTGVKTQNTLFALNQYYNVSVSSNTDTSDNSVFAVYTFWDETGSTSFIYFKTADVDSETGFVETCRRAVSESVELTDPRPVYNASPDCQEPVALPPNEGDVYQVVEVVCQTSDESGVNTVTYTINWRILAEFPLSINTRSHYEPTGGPAGEDFVQLLWINEFGIVPPELFLFEIPAVCAAEGDVGARSADWESVPLPLEARLAYPSQEITRVETPTTEGRSSTTGRRRRNRRKGTTGRN